MTRRKNYVREASQEAQAEPTAEERVESLEATVAELQATVKALDGKVGGVAADVAVAKSNIVFLQEQGWKTRGKGKP